jgi:hypothetical protein
MSASFPPRPEGPSTIVPVAGSVVSALMEEARRAAASGRRALARQRYESALYLLRDSGEAAAASMILRRIGRTYLDDGDFGAGLDCLTAALAVAEANDSPGEIAHTANVMAISYWQRGQLEEGEKLYYEAGRMARIAGDEWLVAMVEQNLGVVPSMRGDIEGALTHYMDSLARYRALRLTNEVARLLSNIGMAHASLERWEEAESTYASRSCSPSNAATRGLTSWSTSTAPHYSLRGATMPTRARYATACCSKLGRCTRRDCWPRHTSTSVSSPARRVGWTRPRIICNRRTPRRRPERISSSPRKQRASRRSSFSRWGVIATPCRR